MPLVRATLATALPAVQQLVGELRKAVREAGAGGVLDQVSASLDALDVYCTRRVLEVDVVLTGALSADEAASVAAALSAALPPDTLLRGASQAVSAECPSPALDLRVHVRPLSQRAVAKAGTPRPPVLALVAPRSLTLTADDRAALERLLEDRPQVLLFGAPEAEHVKEIEARVRALAWSCLKVDPAARPEQSHQARLSAPPFDAFPDVFRAYAATVALESLVNVLGMAVEQQQREIKVTKSVLQQRLGKFQQKTPASPAADVTAEIKTRTQRLAAEFERGAAERLQELLGQPVGSLARELEEMIQGLGELEQQPRSATIATRVPAEFESRMNRTIRERVARHCAQDLVAVNDLFRMIGQDVERALAQSGGPPVSASFRYLTDERVRRMLDAYGAFQSQYKGEMPAKGFGDYFASVRKYSMFLVMGASMFGMSAVLRQYREVVFPVTVMLIAWGTYSVYTGARRQRAETMEKELEAARTSMRGDVKRILGDLQKQWGTFLNQHLNEQTTGGLAELDAAIKDYQARRGTASDPEKDRLQRQMQGLEAGEKKIAAGVKGREALAAAVAQLKGDLKGLAAAPGAGARPAGSAAPGIAAARAAGGAAGRTAMPAAALKPAGPSLAEAKASAMAEAKAKVEAMKAARTAAAPANPAAASPRPVAATKAAPVAAEAAPGSTPAEASGHAADTAAANVAAESTPPAKAGPAASSIAAATANAPAEAKRAADAKPAAGSKPAGEAKPSAVEAFKAKMAALKAAKAAPPPAPAAPAAPAPEAAPAAAPAAAVAPAAPAEPPSEAPAPAAAPAAAPAPVPVAAPPAGGVPSLAPEPAPAVDLDATIALERPRPEAKPTE